MPGNTFVVCAYYFSLPEFPDKCRIVKDDSLLIRDVLVSNPRNPHIQLGGQYDPHYEHDLAPEFKICCKLARRKIMSVIEKGEYDEIYLLFRTNKVSTSNVSNHCISGYYKVDSDKVGIDPNYGEPVIYAEEARFVDVDNAISISDFLIRSGNYRFPVSSETKNGIYGEYLDRYKEKINSAKNRLDDYVSVTKQLNGIFKYYEFEEGEYHICEDCRNEQCFLRKRIRKKGKLFHQLPRSVAGRINEYYKRTVKMCS